MLFNKIYFRDKKELLDLKNCNIIFRNAVRAVIINGNNLLMAHLEKTNEYKFPGGGKNENETIEEAIKREVLEEVGYNVKEIYEKIGTITEYAIAKEGGNNIFKMDSEYYLVEIENLQLKQNLDDYEKELLFKPCWVNMKIAYETNKRNVENNIPKTTGINREIIALEKLIEKYYK